MANDNITLSELDTPTLEKSLAFHKNKINSYTSNLSNTKEHLDQSRKKIDRMTVSAKATDSLVKLIEKELDKRKGEF